MPWHWLRLVFYFTVLLDLREQRLLLGYTVRHVQVEHVHLVQLRRRELGIILIVRILRYQTIGFEEGAVLVDVRRWSRRPPLLHLDQCQLLHEILSILKFLYKLFVILEDVGPPTRKDGTFHQ